MINNKYIIDILNFTLLTLTAVVLVVLQSTSWIQTTYLSTAPQFWVILTSYFSIHKNPIQSLPMIYIIAILYFPLTAMHFGKFLCFQAIVFLCAWIGGVFLNLKNKKIFILFCLFYTLALPILDFIISSLTSIRWTYTYSFFNWVLTALLTAGFAFPLHFLLTKLDHSIQLLKIPKEKRI